MARLGSSWRGVSSYGKRPGRKRSQAPAAHSFAPAAELLEDRTLLAATELLTLQLKPLDIDLLGLKVTSDPITVTVSQSPGDGALLGNLLNTVSSVVNLDEVSTALNQVLGSTVDLLNSVDLQVTGVGSGVFSTHAAATTPVLSLYVAPVQLDLLGAVVTTSAVHLNVTAVAGDGLVLGNVLTDLANLFNPPLPNQLDVATINTKIEDLLADLNAQIPNIPSAPTTPTRAFAPGDVLSLTVPKIDLDLLGLNLQTTPITVDAHATTGDGLLLGNVLTSVLNTLDATPEQLHDLSDNLNGLLAKVVGVLNASDLVLPAGAVDALSDTLKTLALPDLVTAAPGSSAPVLDLVIKSSDGTTPPVMVDLLGVKVTTSDIDATLSAVTGDGKVLGNLVYNVASLLNPGGTAGLFGLITDLATGTSSGPVGTLLDSTTGSTGALKQILTLNLPPIDLDLLGLEVNSSQITVTVSSQAGDGKLLGNAVGAVTALLDTEKISTAVNNVLGSVVSLVNSASLNIGGVLEGAFTNSTDAAIDPVTPVLQLFVAPVHLDLLGVIVDTSPITLTVQARTGFGRVLGNVLTQITDLFNPPLPDQLDLDFINSRLDALLQDLNDQLPGIASATVPPPVIVDNRIVSLTLPAIDLNVLGLLLATEPITVNADAVTGDGLLLGNVLKTVLNTLGATPTQLSELSANLNELLAKVVGVLNASTLTLPASLLDTLTGPLGLLGLPDLVTATPGATTTILDLSIASTDGTTPPVQLDVLGLNVTTSDIDVVLSAQTGDGQILGNLLYNVAHLLDSGSPAALLSLLGQLDVPSIPPADDLIGFVSGEWWVAASNATSFETSLFGRWANTAWDALGQADFDGDGRTDVLGLLDGAWWVGHNTGSAFTTTRWGTWTNKDWRDVTTADLNADGKTDILARLGGNWWAALSNGTGFDAPKLWTSWINADWQHVTATDLNGDHKADLLGYLHGEWWAGLSDGTAFGQPKLWAKWSDVPWQAVGTFDFNGDGRADIYGLIGGAWWAGRSTGAAFSTSLLARWSPLAWKNAVVGDFNNDGRDDVAARSGGNWWVALTQSSGVAAAPKLWGTWANIDWRDVRVGDFNGDGKADLAGRQGGNWWVARSSGTAFTTTLWATWANLAWQSVAAAGFGVAQTLSGSGSGAASSAQSSGQAASAAPASTQTSSTASSPQTSSSSSSSSFAFRRADSAAAAPRSDDPVVLFWSRADKDDAFESLLLAGV